METRANYVLIGLFTLAVIMGGFAFIYWFQHIGGTGERMSYRVLFQGPVSGLRTGSAVIFNGIRVGEVTELRLNAQDPRQVHAYIAIDENTPIRVDTQAGLEFAGLTGNASIALKGGSAQAERLVGRAGEPATITADPGATTEVTQQARDVMRRIDNFIADNEASFKNALRNVETFTDALARNSEKVDRVMVGIERLTGGPDRPGEIAEAAQTFRKAAETLAGSPDNPGELVEAARAVREAATNLDRRFAEISAGVNRFTSSGLREWEALAMEGRRTLTQIERTVKNFDRNPSRVIFGGGGGAVPEYNGRR
jgi:phospholipid/cholesterol/gamma-HCH transport system substrate-binding protein